MMDRSKLDNSMQAVLFLLDIQEDAWVQNGRKRFKGYAQLQRVIEYLINTTEETA